jgi:hypothetical protein
MKPGTAGHPVTEEAAEEVMRITIESTTKTVTLNDVPARIWEGKTDSGIRCHCYITRIGVERDEDSSEFERELQEHRAPSPEIEAIPLRLVI